MILNEDGYINNTIENTKTQYLVLNNITYIPTNDILYVSIKREEPNMIPIQNIKKNYYISSKINQSKKKTKKFNVFNFENGLDKNMISSEIFILGYFLKNKPVLTHIKTRKNKDIHQIVFEIKNKDNLNIFYKIFKNKLKQTYNGLYQINDKIWYEILSEDLEWILDLNKDLISSFLEGYNIQDNKEKLSLKMATYLQTLLFKIDKISIYYYIKKLDKYNIKLYKNRPDIYIFDKYVWYKIKNIIYS